jgi:hypothetical protein
MFRHRDDGRVYLMGGDTDARVWRLGGFESVKTFEQSLTLTDEDRARALAARSADATGEEASGATATLPRVEGVNIDGRMREWHMGDAASLDAGAGRSARIAIGYDQTHLYAAYEVQDDSPMQNAGNDPTMLFDTGDTCEVMLATDSSADPKRDEAAPGDLRLVFSVLQGKPVAVLHESKVRPGTEKSPRTYTSAVGKETLERVAVLEDARVAIRRAGKNGYTLEAAVPLKAIGFEPKPGTKVRGDLGVLFSNRGGSVTVLRAYVNNQDTAITEDLPTEARLQPDKWGLLEVE